MRSSSHLSLISAFRSDGGQTGSYHAVTPVSPPSRKSPWKGRFPAKAAEGMFFEHFVRNQTLCRSLLIASRTVGLESGRLLNRNRSLIQRGNAPRTGP